MEAKFTFHNPEWKFETLKHLPVLSTMLFLLKNGSLKNGPRIGSHHVNRFFYRLSSFLFSFALHLLMPYQ
jgi:hypothetical protein